MIKISQSVKYIKSIEYNIDKMKRILSKLVD